jgi:sugar lactone lactonase YvrE
VEQPTRTKILAVPYALKASESADLQELKELLTGRGFLPNYLTKTIVTTLAGSETAGMADGVGTAASFSGIGGIAVDSSGNVYVADSGNHKIRKVTPAGVVTTLAGSGAAGSTDGVGVAAKFNDPRSVAIDTSGNVYVADGGNYKIRKITSAGLVTTLAGTGTQGSTDGTGAAASFNYPTGVAVDSSGNVYVADSSIRIISPGGVVKTLKNRNSAFAGSFIFSIFVIAVDTLGTIYSSESWEHKVYKISDIDSSGYGSMTGSFGDGYQDVIGGGPARFLDSRSGQVGSLSNPSGVAADSSGNVYIADTGNFAIRKGDRQTGQLSTLAGCGISGSRDGVGSQAMFSSPTAVAVDSSGNVYVADGLKIRKITIIGN